MTSVNPLLAAWEEGRPTFGPFAAIPSGVSAEILANAGPDFVCIDHQHAMLGPDSIMQMIQAINGRGIPAVVRVPTGPQGLAAIEHVLDAGAAGIIAPLVNSAEEAARVVAACRYPPGGVRSFGPIRAGMLLGSWDLDALSQVVCAVQVESEAALQSVEDIAAVPGLDAIYIGPSDLAISLGMPLEELLDRDDPLGDEPIRRIKAACEANNVTVGTACGSGEAARRYAQHGFKFLTFDGDTGVLAAGMKAGLRAARAT